MSTQLNSKDIKLLVDTGAGISVIDEQFLTFLYGENMPTLYTSSSSQVKTVSISHTWYDESNIAGSRRVDTICEFHVVRSLSYEAVLGRDFLRANGTMIDLNNGKGWAHPKSATTCIW